MFWIDASSENSIILTLMQIAQANNLPSGTLYSHVLQWIIDRTRWLIVYDSADGHYSVVEKFLPPGSTGNILITSRNPGLQRITSPQNSVEVLEMGEDEGISLLLKSAMLDGASINNGARKLVSDLGNIPIALDQAGAYMQSCGCSLDEYMELYREFKHPLMSHTDFLGASGYGTFTYGTWDISMQLIDDIAAKHTGQEAYAAQDAIKLLRIFAFLNHTNIPQELFSSAAENYMKRDPDMIKSSLLPLSIGLLDYQTLFITDEGVWDKNKFLGGIQVLLSYSLIKSRNQLYSMHLLVHGWVRHKTAKTQDMLMNHYHRARALLSCSITDDYDIDSYRYCRLLAPHIKAMFLHEAELMLVNTYFDDDFTKFALVFDNIGSWNETESLLPMIIDQRTAKLGSDHPGTLTSMSRLAYILYICSRENGMRQRD